MIEQKKQEINEKISSLQRHVYEFEWMLRTAFLNSKENSKNHITIQNVNNKCDLVKRELQLLLAMWPRDTVQNFQIEWIASKASYYVWRYEDLKRRDIQLIWDLLLIDLSLRK